MHTPGPWTSGRAIPADNTVSRIVRAGADHIAVVMDLDGAAQEAVDNARLIAAAPDLLAALQLIHANAGESPEWIRSRIDAVIARAIGGR